MKYHNERKVSISEHVIKINEHVFFGYQKMKRLFIPDSVQIIEHGAFQECMNVEEIRFGFHSKLKVIPAHCFHGCARLVDFKLPQDLISIGDCAFRDCVSLKEIHIPNTVVEIHPNAFYGWLETQTIYTPIAIPKGLNCHATIVVQPPKPIIINNLPYKPAGEIKYYSVECKCGHVGRDKFMPIVFPMKAYSKKEAAQLAKELPRVKRDHVDAILTCTQISKEQYIELLKNNKADVYLQVKSKHEQKKHLDKIEPRLQVEKPKNIVPKTKTEPLKKTFIKKEVVENKKKFEKYNR
ncbi:MAG: leucine-rich repeat domain-containing protein [bacterium]|nr:leucine-rich repeat domain-containing protein [bacterium]